MTEIAGKPAPNIRLEPTGELPSSPVDGTGTSAGKGGDGAGRKWLPRIKLVVVLGVVVAIGARILDLGRQGVGPPADITTDTAISTPTREPGVGSTWISPKDGMVMMYVPAGEFTMGDTVERGLAYCRKYDLGCQLDISKDEGPPHTVYLDSYWMDRTEITNAMYDMCVNAGVCAPPSLNSSSTRSSYYGDLQYNDYPVIYVNWSQAKTYCEWAGGRLPTEAEWEKAANWDNDKREKRIFPWGDSIDCSFANHWGRNEVCMGDTTPVGSYPSGASFYGLLDMAGNVWEWVMDWYNENYYANSPSGNPQGPNDGSDRVLRGGSWENSVISVRSSNRYNIFPRYMYGDGIGFRCARSQ